MIKKCFILTLAVSLISQITFAQDGYQQPVPLEESEKNSGGLYDQFLQQPKQAPPTFQDPAPQGNVLKGRVVLVPAGSGFEASLSTTISSGINRIGDSVTATVTTPLVIGSDVVVPVGSQLVGQIVNVTPAERFMAASGGVLELRFTTLQTPGGQQYPISASVDQSLFSLNAATGGSRVAMGVAKTAVGAGVGAALGTAIGAISGGKKSVGKGAWSGAAIGGGLGALSALAGKGQELILNSGERLPVRLDQSFHAVVPQQR